MTLLSTVPSVHVSVVMIMPMMAILQPCAQLILIIMGVFRMKLCH
jgi:hypothetical protein